MSMFHNRIQKGSNPIDSEASLPKVDPKDVYVSALVKGQEKYIFLYDEDGRAEALRTLGRFASNPDLSFTWHDAACLSQGMREASSQNGANRDADNPPPLSDES